MIQHSKKKKSLTDLEIERAIKLFGITPSEKSDENEVWMRKNGYVSDKMKSPRKGRYGKK
jgi:hypothetical protein